MWSAGGREMKDALVEFSDILPMLRDMKGRFTHLETVMQGVLELGHDERAYAWAMSNAAAEEHAIRADDNELEDLPF
jgi:hypothetical protein